MEEPMMGCVSGKKLLVSVISLAVFFHSAASGTDITLPSPDKQGGMPLMKALNTRKSHRSFSDKELPLQTLSNLLWAANGINRTETGKRTAPSAMNQQEIDLYAATKTGLFRYNPKAHSLELVVDKDIRHLTGKQPFVKDAPLNLIFVADSSKAVNMSKKDIELYSSVDAGFISQNVYLYCASAGLATVVRGYIDRESLANAMKLGPGKIIIVAQTVGFPK